MSRHVLGLASAATMVLTCVLVTWVMGAWRPDGSPAPSGSWLPQTAARAPVEAPPPSLGSPVGGAGASDDPPSRETFEAAARAAALAEEAARADLTAAAASVDEPLEVRVDLYLQALRDALAASGAESMLEHRSVWTEHFVRMEVVQEELAAASPDARRRALAQIRRRMGYDEPQVARMEELDATREARWAVGLEYMEERRRLESTFEGAVLEDELRRLRERTFGPAAKTIEREEASGFHRFERPRIYGRN